MPPIPANLPQLNLPAPLSASAVQAVTTPRPTHASLDTASQCFAPKLKRKAADPQQKTCGRPRRLSRLIPPLLVTANMEFHSPPP